MKKTILPLCAALLLTAGLVSCGNGDQPTTGTPTTPAATTPAAKETVYLTVWVPAEQVSWAEARIEEFKAANPAKEYHVTVVNCAEGDVQANIKNDPTAAADVFLFAGDHLGPLVEGDYLYEWPSAFVEALLTEIDESVLSSAMVDGKLYGIPYTPNSYFMYYNGDKVTLDETKSLDTLLEKGKVLFDIDNGWYQTAFWYGTGVRFFGEDGTDPTVATLNTEQGYAAARAIRNYINNPNFINGGDDEIKADFKKESDYVAAIGGSWLSAELLTEFGNSLQATTLPTFVEGGNEYHLTATGDWKKAGVAKYTDSPTDAMNLAVWLTNADSMLQKLEAFSETPILKSLANNEAVTSNAIVSALMTQTNTYCVRQPVITQMSNWWSAAENFAKEVIAAKDAGTPISDADCIEWANQLQSDLLKTI